VFALTTLGCKSPEPGPVASTDEPVVAPAEGSESAPVALPDVVVPAVEDVVAATVPPAKTVADFAEEHALKQAKAAAEAGTAAAATAVVTPDVVPATD